MGRHMLNCKVLCKYIVTCHWVHVKLRVWVMDTFQSKLAATGPGLMKWYFEMHVQVYLPMWHEWPAFTVSAEKWGP